LLTTGRRFFNAAHCWEADRQAVLRVCGDQAVWSRLVRCLLPGENKSLLVTPALRSRPVCSDAQRLARFERNGIIRLWLQGRLVVTGARTRSCSLGGPVRSPEGSAISGWPSNRLTGEAFQGQLHRSATAPWALHPLAPAVARPKAQFIESGRILARSFPPFQPEKGGLSYPAHTRNQLGSRSSTAAATQQDDQSIR